MSNALDEFKANPSCYNIKMLMPSIKLIHHRLNNIYKLSIPLGLAAFFLRDENFKHLIRLLLACSENKTNAIREQACDRQESREV